MRKRNKLVEGMGVNDYDDDVNINGRNFKPYAVWAHILKRCYNKNWHSKQPTYIGCTASEEWLRFSNFKKWFDQNYIDGYALDKDILRPGNKVYSAETCLFVPLKVNSFFTFNQNTKNKTSCYPGIHWHKHTKKWKADCNDVTTNKKYYLGYFNNEQEAYQTYRSYKNEQAKILAEEFKISNTKLYDILMKFDVEDYRLKINY